MSLNSEKVLTTFSRNRPNMLLSNLTGGRFDVAPVVAAACWRPVLIWQLNSAEMEGWGVQGQTVCFNILLDANGRPFTADELRAVGASLHYGWDGSVEQRAPFEKIWPEPVANFAMGNGGRYWVEIDSLATPSDRVYGITLQNPADVVDANGHHVTVVVWQYQIEQPTQPIVEPPLIGHATIMQTKISDQVRALDAQIVALQTVRKELYSWLTR